MQNKTKYDWRRTNTGRPEEKNRRPDRIERRNTKYGTGAVFHHAGAALVAEVVSGGG
jgi:hypothetical protein